MKIHAALIAGSAKASLGLSLLLAASAGLAQPRSQVESVATEEVVVSAQEVADELDTPWGMTFLPDGRMLVTELPGNLVIVSQDGTVSDPVQGTPTVFAQGQGGLMDVALHPDFARNRMVISPSPNRAMAARRERRSGADGW